MNTEVRTVAIQTEGAVGEIMEQVLVKGDLSKLTPQERNSYYMQVCRSLGLNPLTQPFAYITLNGKMTLYAKRDAADQLRRINGISVEVVSKDVHDGLLTVHVRAKDKTGRIDEDFGVVSVAGLKGEVAANAFLKAVTKAKRRVTLSISGLGLLDESEVEDIAPISRSAPLAITKASDVPTGELVNDEQYLELTRLIAEVNADEGRFCKFLKIASLADMPVEMYDRAVKELERKRVPA